VAEDTKVLALGLADHEVTQAELDKGAPPVPRFNSPAIAYVSAANLKKGDSVEITLSNTDEALLTNSETLAEDRATYLLQAGKRGVPAGGWPSEWSYFAKLKITRDGKTLIEQATTPMPFE
jgi:hypothetical protein